MFFVLSVWWRFGRYRPPCLRIQWNIVDLGEQGNQKFKMQGSKKVKENRVCPVAKRVGAGVECGASGKR